MNFVMHDCNDILIFINNYMPQVEYEELVAVNLPSTNELPSIKP